MFTPVPPSSRTVRVISNAPACTSSLTSRRALSLSEPMIVAMAAAPGQ